MGTRLREQTEFIPKPLVEIGGKPIFWHIMKLYSHYGYNDFVLALGYKGSAIRDYLLNYEYMLHDFTINLNGKGKNLLNPAGTEDWNITCVDTGLNTMTGGRIQRLEKHVGDRFLCTYGDGVSDVNISSLVEFHEKKGKAATLTAVHPVSRFGDLEVSGELVKSFTEKPPMNSWINGGFFVFEKSVFDRLTGDDCVLEKQPLESLAQEGSLAAFKHEGTWHCMDTYRDYLHLNELWDSGKGSWKVWK